MNQLFRWHWLLAGLLWLSLQPAAHASHIREGNITYASVAAATPGVPRYRVTLRLFRAIAGVAQPTVWLTGTQSSCNSTDPRNFTVDISKSQSTRPSLTVRPGQTVSLTLTATDPDAGQQLRFSSEATSIIPGLSLATLSPTQARLTWQVPASQPVGFYTATVAAADTGGPNSVVARHRIALPLTYKKGPVLLAARGLF